MHFARHNSEKSGFAGTILTDHDNELTEPQHEIQMIERYRFPVAAYAESLGDVP
jgi:hypothetical protein